MSTREVSDRAVSTVGVGLAVGEAYQLPGNAQVVADHLRCEEKSTDSHPSRRPAVGAMGSQKARVTAAGEWTGGGRPFGYPPRWDGVDACRG